jgi:hypothetical protein
VIAAPRADLVPVPEQCHSWWLERVMAIMCCHEDLGSLAVTMNQILLPVLYMLEENQYF